jgi:hypothetical protein
MRVALPKGISEPIALPAMKLSTQVVSTMPPTRVAVAAKKPVATKTAHMPVATIAAFAKTVPAPKQSIPSTLPTKRGPLEIAPRETPADRLTPPEKPLEDDFAPRHDLIITRAIESEGAENAKHDNTHYRLPEGHIDMLMPVPGMFDMPETPDHIESEHTPAFPDIPALPEHPLLTPVPKSPTALPPARTVPHELTPPRKMTSEQIEDAWREGMTLWHEAITKGKWIEAQHIAELLLRLGEPPKTLEAKAMGVVRQAELLRRGHALANINDMDLLRVELSGFHAQYSETLRAYPHEPALYAHLKAVYVGSMGALNVAAMNAAAMNAAAMNAMRGA